MSEYIEGKHAVIEAIRSHVPIKKILLADNAKKDSRITDILRKVKNQDIHLIQVPRSELDDKSLAGNHQGVMAEITPFSYVGVGDILDRALLDAQNFNGSCLVVICDHLTDAGNFGAIIRSAEVIGATGLVIPKKRSARVEASTYKSSAGAVAHIPIAQTANIANTLERFKKEGFWICAATEHSDTLLWDVNLKGKIALVLGSEECGISRLVLEHCDMSAKLPMRGEIESLNVAQAACALMYEWYRQNL